MTVQNYAIYSYNASVVDGSSNIRAWFKDVNSPGDSQLEFNQVEATIPGLGTRSVRSQPLGTNWEIHIKCGDASETNVQTMYTIFNPELGTVPLVALDGNGTSWYVSVRLVNVRRVVGFRGYYIASVRVADPVWRESSLTTTTNSNAVASPVSQTLTNNGTRKTQPAFVITADAAKGLNSCLYGYVFCSQAFYVNRAPYPLSDTPVFLFDSGGAQARLDTLNHAGAGFALKQATGLTSITVDITAGATTITLASSASWPTAGMGFLTDTRGVGFHDQFYYTSISGNVLQGVVWYAASALSGSSASSGSALYTAGGIAHTQAQETAIQPSGTLVSGDDLQVWVDDVPNQNRYLQGWGGTAADVIILATCPEAIKLTATAAATASVPAVGNTLTFLEGASKLAAQGFLAWGNEIFHYSSKTATGVVIDGRALWGTTAATHAVSVNIYANPHRVFMGAGYALAGAPNCDLSRRPAIQFNASSNQVYRYGDQVDDASSIFYDRTKPGRAASWTPGFELDGNTIVPLTQLQTSSTILQFRDRAPSDGSPPYNFVELNLPQGINISSAAALTMDWTPSQIILQLELFLRDFTGKYVLTDSLQQAAAAPARTLSVALADPAYGIKLKGRYNVAAGFFGNLGNSSYNVDNTGINLDAAGALAQTFTLSSPQLINSIALYLDAITATQSCEVRIVSLNGAYPKTNLAANTIVFRYIAASSITTTAGWFSFLSSIATYLPAGEWAIVLYRASTTSAVTWYGEVDNRYGNGSAWERTSATAEDWDDISGIDFTFLIHSVYDSEGNAVINIQDNPVKQTGGARSDKTASFDKVIITLSTTQSVYVHRATAFEYGGSGGVLMHLSGTLANSTNGDSIILNKWMDVASTFTIDCEERRAYYTEDAIVYPCQKAIEPSDLADWMSLAVGSNSVALTDAALITPGQIDLVSTYRGRRS